MSFANKSDVKNHLSTGPSGTLLPLKQQVGPALVGYSRTSIRDTEVKAPISITPAGESSSANPDESITGEEQLVAVRSAGRSS
jgi:hypothetical protein